MILKSGNGWWDVSKFAYGGVFRRADGDMPVEVIPGGGVKYPKRQARFRTADGRQGVCERSALAGD